MASPEAPCSNDLSYESFVDQYNALVGTSTDQTEEQRTLALVGLMDAYPQHFERLAQEKRRASDQRVIEFNHAATQFTEDMHEVMRPNVVSARK